MRNASYAYATFFTIAFSNGEQFILQYVMWMDAVNTSNMSKMDFCEKKNGKCEDTSQV